MTATGWPIARPQVVDDPMHQRIRDRVVREIVPTARQAEAEIPAQQDPGDAQFLQVGDAPSFGVDRSVDPPQHEHLLFVDRDHVVVQVHARARLASFDTAGDLDRQQRAIERREMRREEARRRVLVRELHDPGTESLGLTFQRTHVSPPQFAAMRQRLDRCRPPTIVVLTDANAKALFRALG